MTTKEIRDELLSKLIGGMWSYADLTHNREVIDQALQTAVAEERERCAKVARRFHPAGEAIADAIRKGKP